EDYFKEPIPVQFDDLEDILNSISRKPVKYINIDGDHYKIGFDGFLRMIEDKPDNCIEIDANKLFSEIKFYKFVKKKDERYYSFYTEKFEYELCKEVVASNEGRFNGKLYFSEKGNLHNATYSTNENRAVIEVMINPNDLIKADEGIIEAKKCYVIREVPKEE